MNNYHAYEEALEGYSDNITKRIQSLPSYSKVMAKHKQWWTAADAGQTAYNNEKWAIAATKYELAIKYGKELAPLLVQLRNDIVGIEEPEKDERWEASKSAPLPIQFPQYPRAIETSKAMNKENRRSALRTSWNVIAQDPITKSTVKSAGASQCVLTIKAIEIYSHEFERRIKTCKANLGE